MILSAREESAKTIWQRYSSEVLARIHPTKTTSKTLDQEIYQKLKRGEPGEENPN
jgi:hypothetical protein